ncbi:hypothetical protein F5Y00DRAFT_233810 [Daldinia vernicosa]|uniref:uncharacterized protein n=1 Tax=Daldinia vernicosa TaxID=114800 RepID=UPI00200834FE|nr:uncharacterized protein F5Y00DRAFT_233810 [Daldinia vernicosa]KAI0850174.1 hypothetical protein F5Y00DRAFT_233810 [Daldinia vernicosa]
MSATQKFQSSLSVFALVYSPNGKENRTSPFHRLPVEVVSMIFANMDTWKDFKAAAHSCKRALAITRQNESFIASTWISNMLPPSVEKFGIMAVASRQFGRYEVKEFVEKYISHEGDYPSTYKSMAIASELPELVKAAQLIINTPLVRTPYPNRSPDGIEKTPTEYARELRACFMIETAANLLRGLEHEADENLAEGKFGEMKRAYWTAFSKVEVQAARLMFDNYEQNLFNALNCNRGRNCYLDDKELERSRFSSTNRSFARVFSLEAGLLQMHDWNNRPIILLHWAFRDFKQGRGSGRRDAYQYFDQFLENEDMVFAESPFQPDPKAIDLAARDEFFKANKDDISSYYTCDDLQKGLSCQIFWDQDTFTAWQQQLGEKKLLQWDDPAMHESESEPEPEPEPESEPEEEEQAPSVFDSDDYEFETPSDRELGPELYGRWKNSNSYMSFQEYMSQWRMGREEDEGQYDDEDETDPIIENMVESWAYGENGDENEDETEGDDADDEDEGEGGDESEDEF